ncbi:hypothetical protein FOZ62_022422, partial [Perkinsus olseni]
SPPQPSSPSHAIERRGSGRKAKLCVHHFRNGHCVFGRRCKFAHTLEDLENQDALLENPTRTTTPETALLLPTGLCVEPGDRGINPLFSPPGIPGEGPSPPPAGLFVTHGHSKCSPFILERQRQQLRQE